MAFNIREKVKKFFVPPRTANEQIALKLTKQKYIAHAFYIAMALAIIIAVIKMFALKRPISDYVWEEIIFFVPLFYFAVRHSSTNLKNLKKIIINESRAAVFSVAFLTGFLAMLTCFLAFTAFYLGRKLPLEAGYILMISVISGVAAGLLFYLLLNALLGKKRKKDAAPPPPAQNG